MFYWVALGCMMLFQKDLLKDLIPFADDGTAHDRQLSILAAKRNKIKRIKKPLMYYRIHGNNTFGVAKGNFMREFSPRFLFPLENEIKRIQTYIEKNNYACLEDKDYLNDLLKYYKAKKEKSISFQAMKIAFKYRNIFFSDFHGTEKRLSVLGHILMFDKLYKLLYC